MYHCPCCFESCATEVIFINHWKCKHTTNDSIFRCKQGKCSRVFSDVNVFKKHLIRAHSTDREEENQPLESSSAESMDIENNLAPALSNSNLIINSSPSVDFANNGTSVEESARITPREFAGMLSKSVALFVAKLYANFCVPRSLVQEIINDVRIITDHVGILKTMHIPNETLESENLNQMFDIFQNGFIDHESEHKSLNYFQNLETLILPEQFVINGRMEKKNQKGEPQLSYVEQTISYIPMKSVLKNFLELPGVFNAILSNIEKAEKSEKIVSVVQGTLWKSLKQKISGTLLPLIVYFDDFEINNPLGTHRCFHKMGAVYYTLDCIPDEYASLLENVFLAQFHNTQDYDECDNEQIFWKFILMLIELETTGIIITVDGVQINVKFAMFTMSGDNLGLNGALGYTKGFNSDFNCRGCIANKEQRQNLVIEDSKLMRTEENYNSDVETKSRGIRERCTFNKLISFKAYENFSVDPDHDLLKHGLNVPPPIKKEWLENGQIMYTATEMLTFIEYLPLVIGLLVPEKNKYWHLLLLLRQIVSIVYEPEFIEEDVKKLERLHCTTSPSM
ncbi:uncharacterized protein LOC127286215 [Leptopilina boulardi]|uniref:uncharacterized protein LOC127286215 n=1 Tax=Leptopilina boulardi TaxID=63433 RepID=UPI0021F6810D|nr:uncharacterized protein LOC127286215 [Leptopilina boulardi]